MKYLLEHPVVGNIGEEKYQISLKWRNGVLQVDEPESFGGKDTGPDPLTLLVSSLAGCTLATLRMYIDRKELQIPEISVESNLYQKIENGTVVTYFDKKLTFHQELDDLLLGKLLKVAESCPVSKILKGEIQVNTIIQ